MTRRDHRTLFFIACLTFLAGYLNVLAINVYLLPLSHHTGSLSQLAIAILEGKTGRIHTLLALIASFFLGTFCMGLLLPNRRIEYREPYGIFLYLVALALGVAGLMERGAFFSMVIYALVCGVINAFVVEIRGLRVRITHMTGYLSDAGFELGRAMKGEAQAWWRSAFFLLSILLFFLGGFVAYRLHLWGFLYKPFLAAMFCLALGAYYRRLMKGKGAIE